MEELNGRMIACQILVAGLIARVANDSKDPLRFLSDFRDEIHAVVRQVRIGGALDNERVRQYRRRDSRRTVLADEAAEFGYRRHRLTAVAVAAVRLGHLRIVSFHTAVQAQSRI